jgi:hypothetical protein
MFVYALSKSELQPNGVGEPSVLSTVMIDLMDEYELRIVQATHASEHEEEVPQVEEELKNS